MRTLKEEMLLRKEMERKAPREDDPSAVPTEKSMRLSLWDGSFFGVMSGFSEPFLVPFALLFGAPNILVSMLSTAPVLFGSIIQLLAPKILSALSSRRRYLTTVFAIQGAAWLLLPLVALIPDRRLALVACILLAVASVSLSHAISSVWLSYMGDLVPVRQRSRFFSKRTAIVGAATFVATIAAGFLLKGFKASENIYIGFGILFAVASLARWLSAFAMARSREMPSKQPKKGDSFSLAGFFERAPQSDFGRFVGFAMLFRFSAYIATPFFAVYQLKVLGYDYLSFTILQGAVLVGSILSLQAWGPLLDRIGARRVIIASSFLAAIVPLFWLTTSQFGFLLVFQLFSGVAWAGFNLSVSNYSLEATSPESRPHVLAYSSLLNNASIFAAGLAGGALLSLLDAGLEAAAAPFLILFALSGCFRLLVATMGAPRLHELRLVEISPRGSVYSFVSVLPQQGAIVAYGPGAEPAAFADEVEQKIELQRDAKEELGFLQDKGDDYFEAMPPREQEIYKKKFLERFKK